MGILDVQMQESDGITTLPDVKNPSDDADEINLAATICAIVDDRFQTAKIARMANEERWMRAWRNFRGIYGPEVRFTETEKSNVFVKITKTKTLAAIGQIMDVLMSTGRFPLTVEHTEVPEGTAEEVTVSAKVAGQEDIDLESPYGFFGDGKEWKQGTILEDLVGPALAEKMAKANLTATPGPAKDENGVTLRPAEQSAKMMEKRILDQIEESDGIIHLSHAVFEMACFGTGGINGPFTVEKVYHKWVKDENAPDGPMKYAPIRKDVPKLTSSSIWHLYPDPEALVTSDCNYMIKRHGFTASKLRSLKNRPAFRPMVIEYILENYIPDYTPEWFEQELKDQGSETTTTRYEVKEYWGIMDKQLVEEFGIPIPEELVDQTDIQINAWICCNQVIRLILNPFLPARMPWVLCPFEINPYQIWGIGVPENMDDCQTIMNGHARMAIDNLALSGNAVFEMDETYLVNGEDTRMYPGRVFRRQGGPPGQSIFMLQFPNTTQENMQMFDKFRQLADEATGIPSYSHGQTGVSGTTRTSSGMSMLLGASAINIKSVLRNIDMYIIKPIGEAFFAWNMQFNKEDMAIRGDLEIKARGTASLMIKEVRSQRLLMFMQVAANPMLAPFVKWPRVLQEFAKDMEIDPNKLINNMEEAKLQALLLGSLQQPPPGQGADGGASADAPGPVGPQGPAGASKRPGGASPKDTQGSGNGTIGTGTPSAPGTTGFTGRPQ